MAEPGYPGGSAVLTSCSLLHQVAEVILGRPGSHMCAGLGHFLLHVPPSLMAPLSMYTLTGLLPVEYSSGPALYPPSPKVSG